MLYLPNLKSLSPLTTKIWKTIQNVENGVVLGSSVTQGHWKEHQSIEHLRVPISVPYSIVILCPYFAPFVRHSQISVENRRFNLPHIYLAPPLGMTPLEFRRHLWQQKPRRIAISCGVKISPVVSLDRLFLLHVSWWRLTSEDKTLNCTIARAQQ